MNRSLIILLLLFSVKLFAGNINGIVFNANSKAPLVDCQILLLEEGKVVATASSNFEGRFSIAFKKNKNYTFEIIKSGYKTESIDIYTDQIFMDKASEMEIYLETLDLKPKFEKMQDGVLQKEPNPDIMEDIGDISSLPEGYKILEAKPLKYNEEKQSNFNVNLNRTERTNVNVEVLKESFNKESLHATMQSDKEMFPSSYFAEGNIYYGSGKVLLTENVKEILDGVAAKMNAESEIILKITAFADAEREVEIGDYVAKLRAEEIIKYLMSKGVSFDQLKVSIVGNTSLENECYQDVECDEFQHQQNRRVDLVFAR